MIKSLFTALLLASISLLSTAQAAPRIELKTITLSVENMTCTMCPITVRKSLDKIPGVIAASADYETRTAKVTFDPAQTDVEALTEATANAGYPSTLKAEQ